MWLATFLSRQLLCSWWRCLHPQLQAATILSTASNQLSSALVAQYFPDDANSELDFGSLEKRLALKSTDDDVAAVLKCINAKYTLHRLKMWGLENITGRGLESLRGSAVIDQIDMRI